MKDDSPVSHPHEYYVDLVNRSRKIPTNKMTRSERDNGHLQFGNNFYLLFLGRQRAERAPDPQEYRQHDPIVSGYLGTAETKYSRQWSSFLDHNRPLIGQINTALDGISVYSEALHHYRDLLVEERRTQNSSRAVEFEALGLESVGIYAWRQLNPLLEKAAGRMKDEGINAKEFFV